MLLLLWNILRMLLIILLLGAGALYMCGSIPTFRRYKLIQAIPGPKGVFFFGNALQIVRIPIEESFDWFQNLFKDYDRMMRHWILGFSTVYLKDPKDIQEIFHNVDHIQKGLEYYILHPWLNEGLLTSFGDKWHMRRKILTPSFHFKILEGNMNSLNKNAKILCQKLQQKHGQDIDIAHYVNLCTLDVITETTMGINLNVQLTGGGKYESEIKNVTKLTMYRLIRPHLYNEKIFYLSPSGREFRKSVRNLHEFTESVIQEKKKKLLSSSKTKETSSPSGKVLRPFLDNILEYEQMNPGSFSDADIREEVDTFMFEGHDTTSSALTFIFFSLARYQDVQDKVYKEQQDIFGDSDEDMTLNDLHRMVYLEKVIKESLRLYPSVPAITRLIEKDLILSDGIIVPPQTDVVIPIILVHRNEKYWPDPEKFDPERFAEDQIQGRHPYAFIPFSAGHRNCIGQKLAMMELKTIVATVIKRLKILPVTKENQFNLGLFLVLRPTAPIKCQFVKR